MNIGVRPGLRVLFFITLLAATLVATPGAAAADSQTTPPAQPAQPALLYRVRYGAPWRGEIEQRYFIERNITLAAEQGIAVGDYDPDGDGWAIVGHTGTEFDGRKIGGFSITKQKVPSIMLYWNDDKQCALLTPVSLAVVKPDEDRLLKATNQRMCFAPSTDVSVVILPAPLEMPTQATDEPIQAIPVPAPSLAPQDLPVQLSEIVQPQETSEMQILDMIGHVPVPGLVDAASTDVPNHIDNPGKNTAQVANEADNSLVGIVSIISVGLLAVIVLIKYIIDQILYSL